MKANCGCESGFVKCNKAERLWNNAELVYRSKGYDAWINSASLKAYRRHWERVYEQEHAQLMASD